MVRIEKIYLKVIHYVVLLMSSEDNNKEDTNDCKRRTQMTNKRLYV